MVFEAAGQRITFCEYSEDDFDSYVECYNKFYKGGYPHVEFLERDSLNEILKTRNLLLTLGKLDDGTVVSVSAAKRLTGALEGIVLLFMRCVSPAFQGMHVGTMHEKYLLERIRYNFPGTPSLQADAVTYDIKSQTTLVRSGFTLCGFCFMMYDSNTVLPALSCRPGTRMTFAVYCKPQSIEDVVIYPPEEHKEIILETYRNLGIKCILPEAQMTDETTVYNITRYDGHRTAELYIDKPGNKGLDSMLKELKELTDNGYTVSGHINMSHPGCVPVFRELEKTGFYFAGIRPLSARGQHLVVAHTKNSVCGFDTVFLPEGQDKLLKYIVNGGKQK